MHRAHVPEIPQPGFLLWEATVSLVERKLMEADRLKMCGMMWLKEHETCSPMDATHSATGETVRLLNDEWKRFPLHLQSVFVRGEVRRKLKRKRFEIFTHKQALLYLVSHWVHCCFNYRKDSFLRGYKIFPLILLSIQPHKTWWKPPHGAVRCRMTVTIPWAPLSHDE